MKLTENMKSDFDALLEDDGTLAEAETVAIKRVIAYQVAQEMEAQNISKTKMAQLMDTSRAVVDRLLNPTHSSLTLHTLEAASLALGKKLHISIG